MSDRPFVSFDFPAAGATTKRTIPARLSDVVNVKDWGAVGDSSTNDTAAIQNAIDFCMSTAGGTKPAGGKVFFPPGSYKVTSAITVGSSSANAGVQLIGSGGNGNGANTQIFGNVSGFIFSKGSATYDNIAQVVDVIINNQSTVVDTGALKVTGTNVLLANCTMAGMTIVDASQADGCLILDCLAGGNGGFIAAGNVWPLLEQNSIGFYLGNRGTAINTRVFAGTFIAFAIGGSCASVRSCSSETVTIGVRVGWSPLLTLVTNASAAAGTNVLSFAAFPPGSSIGRGVSGTNIPANTTISRIAGNSVYLSANVTGAGVANGATITFSQENPAVACCVQNYQNEACDTSFDVYNCRSGFLEANSVNATLGRPNPQNIIAASWNSGTHAVTVTTAANHNIPSSALPVRLQPSVNSAGTWLTDTYMVVTALPQPNQFTYSNGPSSAPPAFVANSLDWTLSLHYGTRFRVVSDTVMMANGGSANLSHSSNDMIYATTATPAGEAVHANNVMIASPGGPWAFPVSKNRAAWEFIDCMGDAALTVNSEFQAFPNPYGFMNFADLPGQSGVLQAGPFEGQEFDIIDGNPGAAAFDATITGGASGKYRVRYNGTNWKRVG